MFLNVITVITITILKAVAVGVGTIVALGMLLIVLSLHATGVSKTGNLMTTPKKEMKKKKNTDARINKKSLDESIANGNQVEDNSVVDKYKILTPIQTTKEDEKNSLSLDESIANGNQVEDNSVVDKYKTLTPIQTTKEDEKNNVHKENLIIRENCSKVEDKSIDHKNKKHETLKKTKSILSKKVFYVSKHISHKSYKKYTLTYDLLKKTRVVQTEIVSKSARFYGVVTLVDYDKVDDEIQKFFDFYK